MEEEKRFCGGHMRTYWTIAVTLLLAACASTGPTLQNSVVSPETVATRSQNTITETTPADIHLDDARCHDTVPPSVTVKITVVRAPDRRDVGYAKLGSELDAVEQATFKGMTTFGATGATANFSAQFTGNKLPQGNGRSCFWMRDVHVDFTWTEQVYIVKEVTPGSCPDREIPLHEAKHVKLDNEIAPHMKEAIEAAFKKYGTVSVLASDDTAGMSHLEDDVKKIVEPTGDAFIHQRDQQQRAIDTPTEYRRVNALCSPSDWSSIVHK